jgi:O-antigen/teichoic acid export membrane protein
MQNSKIMQRNKIINQKRQYRRSGFISNTLVLVCGNVIAQALTIGLMPFITRVYSPKVIGIFFIINAITSILIPLSSMRYNLAIQLPEEEKDSNAIALLCIFISLAISIFLIGIIFMWGYFIAAFLNIYESAKLLYIIPLFFILNGLCLIFDPMLLREKIFKPIALSKVALAGVERTTSLGIGLFGTADPGGLIIGRATGLAIQFIFLTTGRGIQGFRKLFLRSCIKRIRKVAKRYKNFPMYILSTFLQRLSTQLPVLVLGVYFSPLIAGYFAFSRRILYEPIEILGAGLAGSYLQKSSELYRTGRNLDVISERLFYMLAAVILIPMLLLGTIGTDLFSILFGADWYEAGLYTQLLTPIYISIFLYRPISCLFDVLEKQKEDFFFNLAYLFLSLTTLVLGGLIGKPILSVCLFSVSTTLLVVTKIAWILSQINISLKVSLFILAQATFRALLFVFPIIIMKYYLNVNCYLILISAIMMFIFYYLYIFFFDRRVRNELSIASQNRKIISKLTNWAGIERSSL